MTFNELMAALHLAESHSGYVQLVSSNLSAPFPKKGYPRGTLLCNNGGGQSVWAYHATSLRLAIERDSSAWIASQKPATITPADNSNPDSEPTGAVDTTFPYGHNQ